MHPRARLLLYLFERLFISASCWYRCNGAGPLAGTVLQLDARAQLVKPEPATNTAQAEGHSSARKRWSAGAACVAGLAGVAGAYWPRFTGPEEPAPATPNTSRPSVLVLDLDDVGIAEDGASPPPPALKVSLAPLTAICLTWFLLSLPLPVQTLLTMTGGPKQWVQLSEVICIFCDMEELHALSQITNHVD